MQTYTGRGPPEFEEPFDKHVDLWWRQSGCDFGPKDRIALQMLERYQRRRLLRTILRRVKDPTAKVTIHEMFYVTEHSIPLVTNGSTNGSNGRIKEK